MDILAVTGGDDIHNFLLDVETAVSAEFGAFLHLRLWIRIVGVCFTSSANDSLMQEKLINLIVN